jgi:hypothetical protein
MESPATAPPLRAPLQLLLTSFHATCGLVVLGVVMYALLDEHRTFLGPAWSSAQRPRTGGWDASLLNARERGEHSSSDHLAREEERRPAHTDPNPSSREPNEQDEACESNCCAETWLVDAADAAPSALLRCANTTASAEQPFGAGVVVVTMITSDVSCPGPCAQGGEAYARDFSAVRPSAVGAHAAP